MSTKLMRTILTASKICTSLLILLTMTGGSSLFAAGNHEATYMIGNLDSFHAGAAGFVRVDDAGVMFRTEDAVVDIPYARITSTALTPKDPNAPNPPAYKIWDRLGAKKHQNLLVNFKDAAGKEQAMTLEVSESTAHDIHDTLVVRTQFQAPTPVVTAKHADAPKTKAKDATAEKQAAEKQASDKPKAPEKQAKVKESAQPKAQQQAKEKPADKTVQASVQASDKAKAKPVDAKPVDTKQQAQAKEKPAKSQPVKAKEEAVQAAAPTKDKPVDTKQQAKEKPVKTKDKPVQAKEKSAQAKDKTVQAKEKPAQAKQQEQAKAQPKDQPNSWWGDDYWKTTRNRDNWATQSASLGK